MLEACTHRTWVLKACIASAYLSASSSDMAPFRCSSFARSRRACKSLSLFSLSLSLSLSLPPSLPPSLPTYLSLSYTHFLCSQFARSYRPR